MEAHGRVGSTINKDHVSINHRPDGDLVESWNFLWRFWKVLLRMRKGLPLEELTAEVNGSSFDGLSEAHVLMVRNLLKFPQETGHIKNMFGKYSTTSKRSEIKMPHVNILTWQELARRYVLTKLFLNGELDSSEVYQGMDVLRCLCGDSRPQYGPLTGVSGLEADAKFLAAAANEIYGSLYDDDLDSDKDSMSQNSTMNEEIPAWVHELRPIKKLKTNNGSRIKACINKSLENDPPEWAKEILVRSMSKDVYKKGNASGPTKKMALDVVKIFRGEMKKDPQDPVARRTRNNFKPISDIVMKQCRVVLRQAAALKQTRKFHNLVGDKLVVCGGNKEGLVGSPAVVSSLLYLRMIDLRLAAGAYCGSHEAFFEDVQEFWRNVQIAFGNNRDLVKLAEESFHAFKSLYLKKVVPLQQKLKNHYNLETVDAVSKKSIDDIVGAVNEITKAPWDKRICKVCGVDQDDRKVLLCDLCDAEYHVYCLSPPLARVPQGSWFCSSCVAGENIAQATLSSNTSVGREQKKQERDFVDVVHNKIVHVADWLREKEYSELTSDKRTLLLKFFCNEMLDSDLIRGHFENCVKKEHTSSVGTEVGINGSVAAFEGQDATSDIKNTDISGQSMHTTTESASPSNRYSLRSEFLGIDSVGKLYWIVDTTTHPLIIVNRIDDLNQDGEKSEDLTKNLASSRIEKLWSNEGLEAYCSWACYQSEAEIRAAIDSLKDDDQIRSQLENALCGQRSRINVPMDESSREGEGSEPIVVMKKGQDLTTNGTGMLVAKRNYVPSVEMGIKGKVAGEGTEKVDPNSVQPLMSKASETLGQLKANLLEMEVAVPKEALRSYKACTYRRRAWRVFVNRASTVFEMVQALIVFEDMIKLNYLDCSWKYWSSISAAAEISTLSALALRIYSLDDAIKYETSSGPSNSVSRESDDDEMSKKRKRAGKETKMNH